MAGLFFLRKPKKPSPANPSPVHSSFVPTAATPIEPESESQSEPEPRFRQVLAPLTPYLDEPPDGLPGMPDLYAILGVDSLVSDEVIRYTYRRRAARLHERAWRPGQAVRQLAELNAAYEILGNAQRRADYDRRRARWAAVQAPLDEMAGDRSASNGRSLPSGQRHGRRRLRLGRASGLVEVVVIALAIGLALYVTTTILSTRSLVNLSWVVELGDSFGLSRRGRPANGMTPTPASQPTAIPIGQSSPLPASAPVAAGPAVAEAGSAAPPVSTAASATLTAPALVAEARPADRAGAGSRFAGSAARVNDPAPRTRSDVAVSARVLRDGAPLAGAQVHLIAHFKTADERWPRGAGTQSTDANGETILVFNIADATPGYPVNVDVIARAGDDQVQLQTSFTPR